MPVPEPEIHETVIDGIRSFWVEGQPPRTVALAFRVGVWDEEILTRGITHLVEHLALYGLRHAEHPHDGETGGTTTTVIASGTPDQLGSFFSALGRQIRDLPLDRLETEVKVLKVEAEHRPVSYAHYLLEVLFGPNGPGLQGAPERGLDLVSPRDVQAWADRYFVRENAVLMFNAEPPETLGLDLPAGAHRPPSLPGDEFGYRPRRMELGGTQDRGICMGSLCPRTVELVMALGILGPRLKERLRHELGLVYAVEPSYVTLDGDTAFVFLGADAPKARLHETASAFLSVVRELRDSPPSAEELSRVLRAGLQPEQVDAAVLAQGEMARAALDRLQGYPHDSLTVIAAEREAATPAGVHEAFRGATDRALVFSPRFEGLDLPAREPRGCDPVEGARFKPKLGATGSVGRMLVGPDGLSAYGDGRWVTLRWEDLVLAERGDPGDWRLLSRNGAWVRISTAEWRRRRKLAKLLGEYVPEEVRLPRSRRE